MLSLFKAEFTVSGNTAVVFPKGALKDVPGKFCKMGSCSTDNFRSSPYPVLLSLDVWSGRKVDAYINILTGTLWLLYSAFSSVLYGHVLCVNSQVFVSPNNENIFRRLFDVVENVMIGILRHHSLLYTSIMKSGRLLSASGFDLIFSLRSNLCESQKWEDMQDRRNFSVPYRGEDHLRTF